MSFTAPFIVIGLAANILWPSVFHMNLEAAGLVVGIAMLLVGVLVWIASAAQVLVAVPKKRLITTGAFAVVLHPLYTSVGLLVIPGVGFVLDTWVGPAIGIVLYAASRLFARSEEKELGSLFPKEYPAYRGRVLLPWL